MAAGVLFSCVILFWSPDPETGYQEGFYWAIFKSYKWVRQSVHGQPSLEHAILKAEIEMADMVTIERVM